MFTQSSIFPSRVNTRMMCLSLPLNQGGCIYSNKEFTHSYGKNVPKLPLGLGFFLSSFLQVRNLFPCSLLIRYLKQFLRWWWWDNQLLEEILPSMSWIYYFSWSLYILELLYRSQTIHHLHPRVSHVIITFIRKWSIILHLALLHVMFPSSCYLLRNDLTSFYMVLLEGVHSSSLDSPT